MASGFQSSPKLAPIFKNGNKRVSDSNPSTPTPKKQKQKGLNGSSNNFSILSDYGDMDADMKLMQEKNNELRKSQKPMPSIVITQDLKQPKETLKKIQAWAKDKIHFKIKGGNTEVLTYTVEDHTAVQTNLREVQIEYITRAPPNTQNKRVVLKGIDKEYTTDEILMDLKNQGLNVIKVEQLISKRTGMSSDRNPCSVWFSPETNMAFVTRNIKYCCHYRIQWINFTSSRVNRTIQCYRCQEPGHKAQYCGKRYRCVKCIGVHEPGQCPKKEDDKPRCVNCQLFHPANYHGCVILKEHNKKSHPTRTRNMNNRNKSFTHTNKNLIKNQDNKKPTTIVQSHIGTYSQVLTGQNRSSNNRRSLGNIDNIFNDKSSNSFATGNSGRANDNQSGGIFSFLQSEVNDLFNVSLPDFMKHLKEFIPKYKSLTDDMSKKFCVIDFLSMFV